LLKKNVMGVLLKRGRDKRKAGEGNSERGKKELW
jgi:hypothetical protein